MSQKVWVIHMKHILLFLICGPWITFSATQKKLCYLLFTSDIEKIINCDVLQRSHNQIDE